MSSAAEPGLNEPHAEPVPGGTFVEKPFMAAMRKMPWNEFLAFVNPSKVPVHVPNPRRQAAGKLNRQKRKGLTEAGRKKLQVSAVNYQPWRHSTGPRTVDGKHRSSQNGRHRQKGSVSLRQMKADLRATMACGDKLSVILKLLSLG